jgi:hypothetical protein
MNEQVPKLIDNYKELATTLGGEVGNEIKKLTGDLEHLYEAAKLTGDFSSFNETKDKLD